MPTAEGDGRYFLVVTDTNRRVAGQWTGNTLDDVYSVDVVTGERKLVKKNFDGFTFPSSTGKYILLYDRKTKQYLAWDGNAVKTISSKIKVPLYNEDHDSPSDPAPYGIMGWHEGDSAVYVYDRYDIWKISLDASNKTENILQGLGRKNKTDLSSVSKRPGEEILHCEGCGGVASL